MNENFDIPACLKKGLKLNKKQVDILLRLNSIALDIENKGNDFYFERCSCNFELSLIKTCLTEKELLIALKINPELLEILI